MSITREERNEFERELKHDSQSFDEYKAPSNETKSFNNGGSTDYYKFKTEWKECADIIEDRMMNYNKGNIFKAAFCFNVGRHDGTDYERELNKIIYFAQRELSILNE